MRVEILGSGGAATIPRPGCALPRVRRRRASKAAGTSVPGRASSSTGRTSSSTRRRSRSCSSSGPRSVRSPRASTRTGIPTTRWAGASGRRGTATSATWPIEAKRPRVTDVYLPEQVASDHREWLGGMAHLEFMASRGWIRIHELRDGETVEIGDVQIRPFRLAEDYVYAFELRQGDRRLLVAMDELNGWTPPGDLCGSRPRRAADGDLRAPPAWWRAADRQRPSRAALRGDVRRDARDGRCARREDGSCFTTSRRWTSSPTTICCSWRRSSAPRAGRSRSRGTASSSTCEPFGTKAARTLLTDPRCLTPRPSLPGRRGSFGTKSARKALTDLRCLTPHPTASSSDNVGMVRSLVTIDLAAVRHNATRLREVVGSAEVWAVVKADAYGHGAVDVARAAVEGGDHRALRRHGRRRARSSARTSAPRASSCSAPRGPTSSPAARDAGLELTVVAAGPLPEGLPLHLKLDTGMGRWGLSELAAPGRSVVALMTHFASSETDAASRGFSSSGSCRRRVARAPRPARGEQRRGARSSRDPPRCGPLRHRPLRRRSVRRGRARSRAPTRAALGVRGGAGGGAGSRERAPGTADVSSPPSPSAWASSRSGTRTGSRAT